VALDADVCEVRHLPLLQMCLVSIQVVPNCAQEGLPQSASVRQLLVGLHVPVAASQLALASGGVKLTEH
jgi:hypothetical protein